MFYAGHSSIDVTPPVGYMLQGHAARKQPSQMIHDPLFLKALSISYGESRVVLITSDLIYFSKKLVDEIKAEVELRVGVAPDQIMLTAAHTHTGPFLFSSKANDERLLEDYISVLRKKAVGAVMEAVTREAPAVLRWGESTVNIGVVNRRSKDADGRFQMAPNFDRPIDPQVTVLSVCEPSGQLRTILCNYTCHPTVLNTDIYQISADYPGVAQRVLQEMYPGATAMFTNGCCGDVRPAIIDVATGEFKGGSFEDTERMGRTLAAAAAIAVEQSEELPVANVKGYLQTVNLPLNKELLPLDKEKLEAAYQIHQRSLTSHDGDSLNAWRDYWRKHLAENKKVPEIVPVEIQALRIGSACLVGIAGETMVEIGLKIKAGAAAKQKKLLLCGDANGVIGYLPTTEALSEGGYETNTFLHRPYSAPYAPGMDSELERAVLDLLG